MSSPSIESIRKLLEGYGIINTILGDDWISDCRDNEIIPHVNEITRNVFTGEETVTEYYNGNGQDTLILNRRPVNEIVSIAHVGTAAIGNFSNAVELISAEGIIKARDSYSEGVYSPIFFKGNKNIKVTYKYGMTDYPSDVSRAIKNLVAAKALALIGARTGGGSVQVQSHGRNYGSHGKYTDIRKELVSSAYQLLRKYMTYVTGG